VVFGPGDDFVLGFDTGTNDPFAIRYFDVAGQGGQLLAEFDAGPAVLPGQQVQPGFVLLDGTLNVNSTTAGRARARYQLRYDVRALGRAGIRATDLRLMRFNGRTDTWVRARRLLKDVGARTGARFLVGRRANFKLGNFGVDTERSLVWGIMDADGRYAIGAAQVPEPLTLLLVTGGLLGIVLSRRRRSDEDSAS
jgi:hypothetical protein